MIGLAAGCLPAPHAAPPGDGAANDGPGSLLCPSGQPVVYDDFKVDQMGSPSCGKGMLMDGGANVSDANGNLVIESSGVPQSFDACVYSPFPSDASPIVAAVTRVTSLLAGGGDYTYMYMYSGGEKVQLMAQANGVTNTIVFYDHLAQQQGPMVAATSTWWRIVVLDATHVEADVSTDGSHWQTIGSSAIAAGATAVEIGAFSGSGQQAPVAAFDFLDYCR